MTEAAGLVAAIAALVTAFAGLIATIHNGRKIAGVHDIVDGRTSGLMERVDQLTVALAGSDTDVPPAPITPVEETTG